MTQREVWLEVAERLAEDDYYGMCRAFRDFGFLPPMEYCDCDPHENDGAARCLLACLFAAMSDKERRGIGLP